MAEIKIEGNFFEKKGGDNKHPYINIEIIINKLLQQVNKNQKMKYTFFPSIEFIFKVSTKEKRKKKVERKEIL